MAEKLKTLHRRRFPEAFEAMLEEMDRHQPEKGDSWQNRSPYELMEMLHKALTDYGWGYGSTHALDIANLAVMIHLKLKDEEEEWSGFLARGLDGLSRPNLWKRAEQTTIDCSATEAGVFSEYLRLLRADEFEAALRGEAEAG